jgi:hypothetical protein
MRRAAATEFRPVFQGRHRVELQPIRRVATVEFFLQVLFIRRNATSDLSALPPGLERPG